jgi:hypothetical protein
LLTQEGANGRVASISIFDSRAEAQASNEVAQKWVRENLPFMAKPHETAGELVTH